MSDVNAELAKASGQIAIDTAADARRALGSVFGEAATELAHILSDNVKLWRFKNLLKIKDRVDEIAARRGLSQNQLQALPLGEALRITNAAGDEDEAEVQNLWARLIVNATAGRTQKIERAYVDLLKSLSPSEVLLLDAIWTTAQIPRAGADYRTYYAALKEIANTSSGQAWLLIDEAARHVAVQNLQRLRCIAPPPPRTDPFMLKTNLVETD